VPPCPAERDQTVKLSRPRDRYVVARVSAARFARRLLHIWIAAPFVPIALFFIVGALASWRATRLEIRPELWTLLSADQPSVVEIKRTLARTRGLSNVFVLLEGRDRQQLRRLGDALVPQLLAIGSPWVGSAESGVQQLRAFVAPRAGLFASVAELRRLLDDLQGEERRHFRRAIGANFDDEPAEAPAPITAGRLQDLLGSKSEYVARYPDGYYESPDGTALVVVARSSVLPDDLSRSREALRRITGVVDQVRAQPGFAGIAVNYAGDLVTGLGEYSAIRHDLLEVGLLGVGLVLGVALLFYRRIRALVLMGATIATGVALTFGLTQLVVGSLNIATGFLFSIVAGNGINAGIILQSRYFEERQRHGPRRAVLIAARTTARPTLAATLAAAVAYLALAATDFQAFRQFAFIGCAGMLLCWLTTYGLLPALLVASDRVWPLRRGPIATRFSAPFATLVARWPRAIALVGAALAILGLGLTVRYVAADPLEYNLRHMENDRTLTGPLYRASAVAAGIVGARTEGAMVVLADRLDQVAPLQASLRAVRDAAPSGEKPFEEVHGLLDFVPPDQNAKLPLLTELRRRLLRAHERGFIDEHDWAQIVPYLPPSDLRSFSAGDLPSAVRMPFTERDGSVGRILFIEPTAGRSDSDVHYLLAWADSFRRTRLPSGEIIHGSGRAVIYADLVGAVVRNMPRALGLALGLTLLSVALGFRRWADLVPIFAALFVGLAWAGGALALLGVRIHFINFVALPITLGVGVDYALNIMSRYRDAGGGTAGVDTALRHGGGPVILCSLTTTLGYLALLRSRNQAVRSLGTIAVLGEVSCLCAALLVLPAALRWLARARRRRASLQQSQVDLQM
jgi:predicted RND superfamily exporter protein